MQWYPPPSNSASTHFFSWTSQRPTGSEKTVTRRSRSVQCCAHCVWPDSAALYWLRLSLLQRSEKSLFAALYEKLSPKASPLKWGVWFRKTPLISMVEKGHWYPYLNRLNWNILQNFVTDALPFGPGRRCLKLFRQLPFSILCWHRHRGWICFDRDASTMHTPPNFVLFRATVKHSFERYHSASLISVQKKSILVYVDRNLNDGLVTSVSEWGSGKWGLRVVRIACNYPRSSLGWQLLCFFPLPSFYGTLYESHHVYKYYFSLKHRALSIVRIRLNLLSWDWTVAIPRCWSGILPLKVLYRRGEEHSCPMQKTRKKCSYYSCEQEMN